VATIKDVAKLAGVSIATVSYVINNTKPVSPETRRRVLEAIAKLDYHPNVIARSLQGRRTNTIGFVISSQVRRLSDPFYLELISGIADEAANQGFHILFSICPAETLEEVELYRELVKTGRVDGLIIPDTRLNDPRLTFLLEEDFPFVTFGRSDKEKDFPYVDVDGFTGIYLAMEHLISSGHSRIAFIGMPSELVCAGHRLNGYKAALSEYNLPFDQNLVVEGDLTQQGGYRAMRELLALEPPPDAVVVCSDLMAFGAINALREQGLKAGKDIAVFGFDDIPMAAHFNPPLTTIHQPIYEIGSRLIKMLTTILNGDELEEKHIILEPSLVVRQSSISNG